MIINLDLFLAISFERMNGSYILVRADRIRNSSGEKGRNSSGEKGNLLDKLRPSP